MADRGASARGRPALIVAVALAVLVSGLSPTAPGAAGARAGAAGEVRSAGSGALLAGGSIAPTVTLPTPNWRNLSTGPSDAAPATSGALAYDAADGVALWVGGFAGPSEVAETWSYHAGTWTNLTGTLTTSPPASQLPALAFDPIAGAAILVVGAPGDTSEQTWAFAAGGWTNLTNGSAPAPTSREGTSLAFGPACGCLVLFGGLGSGDWLNDTWTWASGSWTAVPTTVAPSDREGAGVIADPASGGILLVGGIDANGPRSDTWTFVSGSWSAVSGAGAPAGLAVGPSALALDPDGAVVAFGGLGCAGAALGLCGATWAYQSGLWQPIPTAAPPSAREGFELAYDAADGYVLGFGGSRGWSSTNETWALGGPVVARLVLTPQNSQAPNLTVLTTYASGGYGGYHYVYLFPDSEEGSDCPSQDVPSYRCSFDLDDVGNRTVQVNVTDGVGNVTSTTSVLHLVTPFLVDLSFSSLNVDVGDPVQIRAISPPTYPAVNFTWYGLPYDCYPAATANLTCTTALTGFYAIYCVLKDAAGTVGTTGTFALHVATTPLVGTWPSRVAGDAPLTVAFNSTVSGGTAPFVYNWSFGDGATSALAAPSHTYTTSGSYPVTLTLVDATGHTTTAAEPFPIVVGSPLTANITAEGAVGTAPTVVNLTAHVTGGVAPYTFAWGIPGGGTSGFSNVSVKIASAGAYLVNVTVVDGAGSSVHASATIAVAGTPAGSGATSTSAPDLTTVAAVGVVAAIVGLAIGAVVGRRGRPPPSAPDG